MIFQNLGRSWRTEENARDADDSRHSVQQERIDMYMTSGPVSADLRRLTSGHSYPLCYTTPRAASLTNNHEIIGNDADM